VRSHAIMRASLHNATTEVLLPHKYDNSPSPQSGPVSLFGTTIPTSAPNYGGDGRWTPISKRPHLEGRPGRRSAIGASIRHRSRHRQHEERWPSRALLAAVPGILDP